MERKLLLEIPTHHGPDSPHWGPDDLNGKFVSYFENCHGEQWVFLYDGPTKEALLYGGDCEWKPYPVVDGQVGLMLEEDEQLWLRACWSAAHTRFGWR
jgi:hypothetical protein